MIRWEMTELELAIAAMKQWNASLEPDAVVDEESGLTVAHVQAVIEAAERFIIPPPLSSQP